MNLAKTSVFLVAIAAASCNDSGLTSMGQKTPSGESKKSNEQEKSLGNESSDTDQAGGKASGKSGENDGSTKPGALGEAGDGTKTGNLDESDDLVKTCKNKPLKTSVKLLTPTIANGVPGNKVVYELQLLDCKGKPRPISAQFIHFDLDAEVDDPIPNTYVVQIGSQVVSGTLEVVDGVDLFGKSGDGYFHHKTDQSLSLTETDLTAVLTIDLKGQLHGPIGDEPGGSFSCQSFLRFGEADPVAQLVTFVE